MYCIHLGIPVQNVQNHFYFSVCSLLGRGADSRAYGPATIIPVYSCPDRLLAFFHYSLFHFQLFLPTLWSPGGLSECPSSLRAPLPLRLSAAARYTSFSATAGRTRKRRKREEGDPQGGSGKGWREGGGKGRIGGFGATYGTDGRSEGKEEEKEKREQKSEKDFESPDGK